MAEAVTSYTHEGLELRWVGATVERLSLQPGDVLVLRFAQPVTAEMQREAKHYLETEYPGHRCLFLDASVTLQVLSEAEANTDEAEAPAKPARKKGKA